MDSDFQLRLGKLGPEWKRCASGVHGDPRRAMGLSYREARPFLISGIGCETLSGPDHCLQGQVALHSPVRLKASATSSTHRGREQRPVRAHRRVERYRVQIVVSIGALWTGKVGFGVRVESLGRGAFRPASPTSSLKAHSSPPLSTGTACVSLGVRSPMREPPLLSMTSVVLVLVLGALCLCALLML